MCFLMKNNLMIQKKISIIDFLYLIEKNENKNKKNLVYPGSLSLVVTKCVQRLSTAALYQNMYTF